jgi:hypothetical protein
MGSQGQPREGILSTTTFPGLIYSIFRLRETGVLTFTGETSEKSIYIKGGRPIFATSGDRDDRLGNIFFKAGLVSLDTLLTGVDDSIRLKKRLGTILVEAGSIQPHDLVEAVLPSEEVITLKLSASEIVLEGVKRIESWERIWEAVGDLDACYRTCDGIEQQVRDLKLALPEWTLLSHFDRSITVRDLCGSSEMKDFEICRLLWALVTLGIVQRTSASR